MADSKISALPASTTPLAGTEVLPIVQSSATKQVSVANLTAGRAISATQLTLTTGNLIVASGQGVDFSDTPSGSGTMTSELFNDYEEGTWTPSIGGTATYTTQTGRYTKIGRLVTFFGDLTINVQGTGNAGAISGLPFTALGNNPVYVGYFAGVGALVSSISPFVGGTSINLYGVTAAASTESGLSLMTSGARLMFQGSYEV
jgi:hypothetical protein